MTIPADLMNWMGVVGFVVTVVGTVVGVVGLAYGFVFYYRTKLTAQRLDFVKAEYENALKAEQARYDALKQNIHWQLQALHHSCNRLENVVRDPTRSTEAVDEIARCIRDEVNALMGQTTGRIALFPSNNYPIVDPVTGAEVGRMVDKRQYFTTDWRAQFPHRFGDAVRAEAARGVLAAGDGAAEAALPGVAFPADGTPPAPA